MTGANHPNPAASPALRRWLLATYLVGAIGLGIELFLMEHVEGIWQQLPLWVLAASVATLGTLALLPRPAVIRLFQGGMFTLALCGVLGVYLHFEGKAEFKRELDPTLNGWALVWECLHGHSLPPVLAPGMLVMLGMLGLAYAYRHPALLPRNHSPSTPET